MSTIGFEEVAAAVDNKSPPILDVRTEDEFASGRIPGATNIPLSEVKQSAVTATWPLTQFPSLLCPC